MKSKRKSKPKKKAAPKKAAKAKAKPKKAAKAPKIKASKPKAKPRKSKPKATKAKRPAAKKPAKRKTRRKAKKTASANNLTRLVEETLRETGKPGYGGNTGTRSAKTRTQKEAPMAAKKRKKASSKKGKKAAKRKAPKRKAAPKAAAPKKRKKARRKAPAAAAPAPAPKKSKPRKKPRKAGPGRTGGSGKSGPGQFGPGPNNTSIEVRRADDGHFSRLRSQPAKHAGEGEIEVIPIHRNPVDTGMFIATAALGGGLGFGIATAAGRLYVTSNFALSREKDANGNPLYVVDKATGKITHADGTPVTGTDYAALVQAHSWVRDLISGGVAAASILTGMYVFEPGGIPRTAAIWIGVGSAVEGGVSILGKLVLPWMLRKNQTFATRLAPQETTTYLLQHPDAQADQPTFAGAPDTKGAGDPGLGCSGDATCGCGGCCAKRQQALDDCIQSYAEKSAPRNPPRSTVTATPTNVPTPAPTPTATQSAPPATIMSMPMGDAPDAEPFVPARMRRVG